LEIIDGCPKVVYKYRTERKKNTLKWIWRTIFINMNEKLKCHANRWVEEFFGFKTTKRWKILKYSNDHDWDSNPDPSWLFTRLAWYNHDDRVMWKIRWNEWIFAPNVTWYNILEEIRNWIAEYKVICDLNVR
jgi:hypothetical protein